MKKTLKTLFIYIFVFVMCVGASFAWYVWKGNEVSVSVNFADLDPYIKYSSTKVEGKTITPSTDYKGGVSNDITFNKEESGDNLNVYGHVYLKVTSADNDNLFKASNLKWTLVSVNNNTETEISTGNFVGESVVSDNDTSKMIPANINFPLTKDNENTTYKVYVWVDSNAPMNKDISSNDIKVETYVEANTYTSDADKLNELHIREIDYQEGKITKIVGYSSINNITHYMITSSTTNPSSSDSGWISTSSSSTLVTITPNYTMNENNNICIKDSENNIYCKSIGKYSDEVARPTDALCKSGLTYNGDDQVLVKSTSGTGYTLSNNYNQTNAGSYDITATLKDNYSWKDDTTSKTATITCSIAAYDLSNATIASVSNQTYTGNAITPTPAVIVPLSSGTESTTTLVSGTDFTYSYSNNKDAGEATITITGKGNYTGTKSTNFKISYKTFNITLDNQSATTSGTTTIYGRYADGIYLDSSYSKKMTTSSNNITVPEKTGYTFKGYYTSNNPSENDTPLINSSGNITSSFTSTLYNSNTTLYAKWDIKSFTVTYDCTTNGGTANTTSTVEYNSSADLTKTCSKSGWTFVGWNTSSTATSKLNSYTVTDKVTLYGIYKKEEIKLTAKWNANGASLSSTADSECTLAAVYNKATQSTSCTITAPTITRSGYTIVGYNTSSSSTTNNSSYNTKSKELTLTSSNTGKTWYAISSKELSANFYYNNDNGTSQTGTSQTSTSATCIIYNTNSSCSVTAPSITSSTGYGTGKWGTSSSTQGNISAGSSITLSSNATYYAIALPNTYTVTLNSGNLITGLEDISSTTTDRMSYSVSNKVVTVTANYDDGYGFINGRVYLEANTTYIFSCDTNGTWGTGSSNVESYLMLDGQYNTYYHMASNNNYSFTPTVSGTYYIRLDVNESGKTYNFYNITISKNISTKTVTYKSTYGELIEPTREGYTFKGWYNGSTKITSSSTYDTAGNVTLTASWLDETPPTCSISGGTTLKSTSQTLTASCSDGVGVTGYYWSKNSSTAPTASSTWTTNKTYSVSANDISKYSSYRLWAKDAAGNISSVASVRIVKYNVNNLLENVNGTTDTYTSENYTSVSSTATSYIVQEGTTLTLADIYTAPTESSFKGYSTSFSTSEASLSTTAPTVTAGASIITYYMWFNRNTFTLNVQAYASVDVVYCRFNESSTWKLCGSWDSDTKNTGVKYNSTYYYYATPEVNYYMASCSSESSSCSGTMTGDATITVEGTEKSTNTLTVSAKSLTYNGSAQSLVTASSAQGTVYYAVGTQLTSSNYSSSGSTTIPTRTDAGTYTIYYYTPGNTTYLSKSGSVSVTINSVYPTTNLTITANSSSTSYTINSSSASYRCTSSGCASCSGSACYTFSDSEWVTSTNFSWTTSNASSVNFAWNKYGNYTTFSSTISSSENKSTSDSRAINSGGLRLIQITTYGTTASGGNNNVINVYFAWGNSGWYNDSNGYWYYGKSGAALKGSTSSGGVSAYKLTKSDSSYNWWSFDTSGKLIYGYQNSDIYLFWAAPNTLTYDYSTTSASTMWSIYYSRASIIAQYGTSYDRIGTVQSSSTSTSPKVYYTSGSNTGSSSYIACRYWKTSGSEDTTCP